MKVAAIATALFAAIPAVSAAKPFTGMALRSASPIHFAGLEARSGGLWLLGKTKTYCPDVVGDDCPPGKIAALGHVDDSLYMNVEVPGGQAVYITKKGAVKYTAPHSAFMPEGSITGGWKYEPKYFDFGGSKGDRLTHKQGLVACEFKNTGKYQLYVQRPEFNKKGCLGFDFVAQNLTSNAPSAWEYV